MRLVLTQRYRRPFVLPWGMLIEEGDLREDYVVANRDEVAHEYATTQRRLHGFVVAKVSMQRALVDSADREDGKPIAARLPCPSPANRPPPETELSQ
jgi:hypothetical protein